MSRPASSRYAILGMLSLRPMSGYDVRQFAAGSISHFWSENYGQIYPTLRQLHSEGLIARETATAATAGERQVYSLTPEGRAELARWLQLPPEPQPPRSELLLKLFFAGQDPQRTALEHVQRTMREQRVMLQRYREVEDTLRKNHSGHPDFPYWMITLRFGQRRAQGTLDWSAETLATLNALPARGKRRVAASETRTNAKGKSKLRKRTLGKA